MRAHNIQFDQDFQVNPLYAAARVEAKKEAERTRKKLRNFASALAGENNDGEDCVVELSEDDASQGQTNRQNQGGQKEQNGEAKSDSAGDPSSYWA
jgi:hypothetical protein